MTTTDEDDLGRGRKVNPALLVAVFLGTFMALLDMSIVTVALPAIQSDLSAGLAGIQWVIDSYVLCLSSLMLSGGALGDRYGRKRLWLSGVVLFTAGSALCAVASDLPVLVGGRLVQGMAAALLVPGALSILTQSFPHAAQRARLIGWWGMFGGLSVVLGPVLGGLLVDQFGWRSIFLINVPLGLLTLSLGVAAIPESADPAHASVDVPGQALGVLWLGALSYALITGRGVGWTSPPTLTMLVVAIVAFVAFIVAELRADHPMLPVRYFASATFAVTNAVSFMLGFGSYAIFFFLSLYLQQVRHHSATAAGLRFLPLCGAIMLVSVVSGRLTGRHGPRMPMIGGYSLIGLGLLGMCLFEPDTSDLVIGLVFAVTGLGMGMALPATNASVFITVPRQRSGSAAATVNATRQTGTALGVAILGGIISDCAVPVAHQLLEPYGMSDSARQRLAESIVLHHGAAPATDGLLPPTPAAEIFAQAFASGFHVSAAVAGAVSLTAAVFVAVTRWEASE